MNIVTKYDGKETYQSWQATLIRPFSFGGMGFVSEIEIVGYGATETEAKSNLEVMIDSLKSSIACLRFEEQNVSSE